MAVKRVMVGEIGRPHGVRGLVRLRAFTEDPAAIAAYSPLTDESGARSFALTLKGGDIAAVEGVADRDAAQRLTGTKLFVERDRLPAPAEEEFYLTDLIGLAAVTESGESLGRVRAVEDHGAGPFLIVDGAGREYLLPFTKAVVPVVDVAGGSVTVVLPGEIIVQPQAGEDAA
ncbi:16S rRNA processing protein RimM [Roseomonas terrae]|uniref:Ribosome maturation factor RimM n=1 Tax=Neoroseomonas terrae TaxID=424799 RepID=A0ABS5EIB2_9PROT|nr:16S rRNA processing protein RimM [Neoroseomonas terrae]